MNWGIGNDKGDKVGVVQKIGEFANLDLNIDSNIYEISDNLLSKILNISLASRKLKSVSFVNEAGEIIYLTCPQIHIILQGLPGTFKSTIQREVMKISGGTIQTMLTNATFLGSVDKQGNFVEPVVWKSRGSVLGIDDWHFSLRQSGDKKLFESLLKILEDGEYSKPYVWKTPNVKKICRKTGASLIMKNSDLVVKSRFVFFANTMKNLIKKKEQSVDIEALVSRCLVIPFNPRRNMIYEFMKGNKKFFTYKDIRIENDNPRVSKKDYLFILDYVFAQYMSLANTTRTAGLLCKIFCILGKHDQELYEEIIKIRRLV